MDAILEQNLTALRAGQPELAARLGGVAPLAEAQVRPSRGGEPSLRIGNTWLTSTVDPVAEGRDLAAAAPGGPLLVLGFGLGYHVEALANDDLLIWEPDPAALVTALAARDMSGWLGRVRLIVNPPQAEDMAGRGVLIHKPTARLHPGAEAVLERLQSAANTLQRPDTPKVLVIPPIMGGSLPVAHWCAEALSQLGCQVRFLPFQAIQPVYDVMRLSNAPAERLARLQGPLVRYLGETTILAAEEFEADLCFAMAQAPLVPQALKGLRQAGVSTAFWFIENFRLFDYFSDVAPFYDFFFHIQGQALDDHLAALGVDGHFLPVAAHPIRHKPVELSPDDRRDFGGAIGFMGSGAYANRRATLEQLLESGLPLRIWGSEWPADQSGVTRAVQLGGRRLNDEEVVKVYNACEVVINLHSTLNPGDPVGRSDFANPRTFEVPCCGGFQLADQVSGLDRLFSIGEEIVVFDSITDLRQKAEYYLAHPQERAAIAKAGRKRVLAEHTYARRMKQLLDICLGPAKSGQGVTPLHMEQSA